MNQFREQLTNLLEDGIPMPFSELQNKFESVYGRNNEAICTLENIRRLGNGSSHIISCHQISVDMRF